MPFPLPHPTTSFFLEFPLDSNRNAMKTENVSDMFAAVTLAPNPEPGTVRAQE